MKSRIKKLIVLITAIAVSFLIFWLYLADFSKKQTLEFGVTFSDKYAREINLNPQEVLISLLDELKVRKFRLMAYWDSLEKIKDGYDFTNLDWQLNEISRRGGEVSLVIGHRLPRWPECHWPDWTYKLNQAERQKEILELLEVIVSHYKENQSITNWQVENEPFLRVFGECPKPDNDFFKTEVELVRILDNTRPIVVTESGELSSWLRAGKLADYVGTSIYRITWNKRWGYFYYPLPAAHYYLKTKMVKFFTRVNDVFVSEMQMEPWLGMPVLQTPLGEQYRSMNAKQFQKNFNYAKKTGLSPIYLWGAEWWYWLKEQGDNSIWQLAKKIWSS